MKDKNEETNTLPALPDGFDRSKIVMPDTGTRKHASTIRLNRCDFEPMARAHFRGFFAVANHKSIGSDDTVADRAHKILANGGTAYIVNNVRKDKDGNRRAIVRLVEAFSYLDWKYVVLHIEPLNQASN